MDQTQKIAQAFKDQLKNNASPQAPIIPIKKSLKLIRREPCFLMGGNHYLINHLIDNYLELKDVLQIMTTNQSTRKVLLDNKTYWYQLWRNKKYGKPKTHHYFHSNEPLTYECLNSGTYHRVLPDNFVLPSDQTQEITKDDMIELFESRHSFLVNKGYVTSNPVNYSYYNPLGLRCRSNHWEKRGIYPLKYYGNEFDPNQDYFQMIKKTDKIEHLMERLATKKRIYRRTIRRVRNLQNTADWAHKELKLARDDLDVYQRAYDFYLQNNYTRFHFIGTPEE